VSARHRLHIIQPGHAQRELAADPALTLLQQLQRAGFDLPHACRNGNCGRCYAQLHEGETSHTLDQTRVPLCISQALSDIQLTLPKAPQWTLYTCQIKQCREERIDLLLPAGKIALSGKQFALVNTCSASAATLLEQHQRLLALRLSSPLQHTGSGLVQLLCVSANAEGRQPLVFRQKTLATGLSASLVREIHESLLQSSRDAGTS
tara:strand:- start:3353 stop:3970 length:618 start_codon:yes stop_codon:yes gene_type:complete